MISSKDKLVEVLSSEKYDAIVVEGYDGVGKGKLLEYLSEIYGVTPYRPDYNFWQMFDHRPIDRWKVSGFFWDIYSHFNIKHDAPMLFDRGIFSGAVYNNDPTIVENYNSIVRNKNILYILVCCKESDFFTFAKIRGAKEEDIEENWINYLKYTLKYKEYFDLVGVNYIIYFNKLDESLLDLKDSCGSCGHYNYGWCRHPFMNCHVSKESKRCNYSCDEEVQDSCFKDVQPVI